MKSLRLFLPAVAALSAAQAGAATLPNGWEIRGRDSTTQIEADLAGLVRGDISAKGGVVLSFEGITLSADRITGNWLSGDVLAEGAVSVIGKGAAWTGERISYNFSTKQMSAAEFKGGRDPLFISGAGLSFDRDKQFYSATNAVLTTDNYAQPGHRLKARSIRVVPGQYVEADEATLYLGDVPVFYFPHYRRSLERHPYNFSFLPGYRSLYGAYLETKFNFAVDEHLDGALRFDLREKRGVAGGPDINLHLGRWGEAKLKYYIMRDDDPGLDTRTPPQPLPDNRQRLNFSYSAAPWTNFTFKSVVRYQEDPFIVRDFFESEYRQNVQPSTFVEAQKTWPNWSLDMLVQPQVNEFQETVQRLPDVRFTGYRQQLGDSPFFYESESSLGYYQKDFAYGLTPSFAAWRGDSFHQILLPKTFFGWLNFTPRAGGRLTHYSETRGATASADDRDRFVFNTGAEVSFKASRIWRGTANRTFDVDGLRHIVEPSLNYAFVPSPNALPPELPQFDPEIPSLRLLPIEYADYNAIDAVDSQNVLRFSLRNKLQTRRTEGVDNLVNWGVYADWRLKPRQGQRGFSDVYSDLDFKPRSWITFNSMIRYTINDGQIRESLHRAYIQPNDIWHLTLGHRFFDDEATYGPNSGHNLLFSSFYYKLNENWAFRTSHHFEARDGVLEEQYYTLYRDLRSWTAAFTVRKRDNRVREDDITVGVAFSLKAAPRYRLGQDRDEPTTLFGG